MPAAAHSLATLAVGAALSDAACRAVVHGMSHGAVLYDARGIVVLCNPSAERILGLTSDELVGRSPRTDGIERCREDEAPLASDEHPVLVTLRDGVALDAVVIGFRPAAGATRRWLSINTRPVFDRAGTMAVGVVATFSDFSRRRREMAELERLTLVARRTDDAVLVTDAQGRIVWGNAALLRLTGHDLASIQGRTPGAVLQGPESDAGTVAELRRALLAGESWSGELVNYRRDGTSFWHEFAISPARNGAEEITHFVSIGRDITPKKTLARRFLQLSAVVEASVDGIAVVDPSHTVQFANSAFARLFGYESGAALQSRNWRVFYPDSVLELFDQEILRTLYLSDHWQGELAGRRADGSVFPLELTLSVLSGGMVMVVRDISERKQAQAEQVRLNAILEATPDLIAISTVDGTVPYMNAAGWRMVGAEPGVPITLEELFDESALATVRDRAIPHAIAHGSWSGEATLRTRRGADIPVSQVVIAHKNDDGSVEYLSTIMRDITERKESEDALKKMSFSDPLTGLYNRRGFLLLAQQQLNSARRQEGSTLLLYFDLNDFKAINDSYGHQTGDQALQEVAQVLNETFRDSDIVGRLGGDEFVVLAVNCLDPTGDVLLARLAQRLNEQNARPGRTFFLSIAQGVTRFDPNDPKSLQQLLEVADARLYEDKRRRKKR